MIDCRGYPEDYSDYIISDKVYLDSDIVVVHIGVYISHRHEHGWMFHIPLQERTAWGYLWNSEVTSELEAQSNLVNLLGEYQIEYFSED